MFPARLISGDEQGAEASAEIDEMYRRTQKEYDQQSILLWISEDEEFWDTGITS